MTETHFSRLAMNAVASAIAMSVSAVSAQLFACVTEVFNEKQGEKNGNGPQVMISFAAARLLSRRMLRHSATAMSRLIRRWLPLGGTVRGFVLALL